MKLRTSDFCFDDKTHGPMRVHFFHGDRPFVQVFCFNKKILEVPNHHRRIRPCVTHCLEVIDMAFKKKPGSEHAKQRREAVKNSKPLLKIAEER